MFSRFSKMLVNLFGSRNERVVKNYMKTALKAGEYEQQMAELSDDQLRDKTSEFREAIAGGTDPEELLPEAFAVVREVAKRKIDLRHYDVQLVGGNVLFDGKIAEMATGEGKTLVATLACYLMCLTGRKVHIITVNDYLAKRDAEWMRPVYESLGLTVGAIQADMDPGGAERKEQYSKNITYGTNNEFGFDYLRDNMKVSAEQLVQGRLDFALIDEVDSILIDEARTPLIISGPAHDDVTRYKKADSVVRELIRLQGGYNKIQAQIDKLEKDIANAKGISSDSSSSQEQKQKADKDIQAAEQKKAELEAELERHTQYYEVEYDKKSVHLTHEGIGAAQDIANVGSFYVGSNMDWPHLLEQGLRAHVCFEREKDYVVMDGKVVIVDEFTGRLMHGRQWSDGLHQAVEAKEGVKIKEESQTLATITLQNFFKLYDKLAGMTGTAMTEAQEFLEIYGLDVVSIPTNEPCIRDDRDDVIYKTMPEKFNAIVEEIKRESEKGRPVLVGTVSIEKSEAISNALKRKYGVEHEVLNAKQHAREASIVEKAGHQHKGRDGKMWGNVTIATNMAGRGTDIKLGEGVAEAGGLHIVGTERHESRRIDNQLRGRAGRQGDNGSSQFFLSFDDELLSVFAGDWTIKALTKTGWEEGEPIYHKWITNGIEKAQKKVEEKNYEIRKSLLEYDEVMDYQRREFYTRRKNVLKGIGLRKIIEEMMENVVADACDTILADDYPKNCIVEWLRVNLGVDVEPGQIKANSTPEEIEELAKEKARKNIENDISITMGEYIEDSSDKSTWKLDKLSKWLMSTYSANVPLSKLRKMEADEIEQTAVEAASGQLNKKDCSKLAEFLKDGFAERVFTDTVSARFDIKIDPERIKGKESEEVRDYVLSLVYEKYNQREIEYPVEYALSMTYSGDSANVYQFDSLAKWAKHKYNADLNPSELQDMSFHQVEEKLMAIAHENTPEKVLAEVEEKIQSLGAEEAIKWSAQRFGFNLEAENAPKDAEQLKNQVHEFMRRELSRLERYVLLQVFDAAWKDHLYAMDRLKESVSLRRFAEKDPRIEYKHEGYRMFSDMLESIENRVTDTVFKLRLEANAKTKNVYGSQQNEVHQQADQFAQNEKQREAGQAPKASPKQIVNKSPKVGRNDPCPCGSGKKYKKCCGKNK
ncbi:preprotein translocase subunit SecA [Sedimentisphaera salicampi]|uniref:Protein translocase subunit SecA n=1 Tax=Sedimentisphaera salicampi TaxID=1941349 RepID=A0A1W6LMI8_9BACT|nr:preprotein translocase subunit SecA [Sedimentisphaera salicampi]ARN57010.1 preprotein translocase subunit SecA [Sedimentisphaera salicampi]